MNTDIFDIGTTPISAEEPAGHDVSYDDDFDALGYELKKLSSPTADSAIDWDRVKELSIKILKEKSKHLQVACYLCVALCQTDGISGCATGIHVIREMMENYWDTLYPPKKRKKGRINALSWWSEKVQAALEGTEPETWDADSRTRFIDDLTGIDTIIAEKLPDGPVLRPLIDTISTLIVQKKEEQIEPEATETSDQPDAPQEDSSAAPSDTSNTTDDQPSSQHIHSQTDTAAPNSDTFSTFSSEIAKSIENSDVDADKYFADGLDFLAQAATRFLKQDIKRPIGYQINRLIAWSGIDALPPATDGKTMLPPPDEQLVTLLKGQYESGLWDVLLSTAESYVRQYLFWLDLSFYVATALNNLHAQAASMAVAHDTLLFITRLHSIEALCFSNGMPFASEDTRQWLLELSNPAGSDTVSAAPDSDNLLIETESSAMQMAIQQGIGEALSFFKENSGVPDSGRKRFLHDLAICRIMLKAKQIDMARPFASRLINMVNAMDMESWEPRLALEALMAAYRTFKQASDEDTKDQAVGIRQRIILLAPERAASLI